MPLGTLDRTPPPFFKQGMPALTKLLFFSALAFFLMVADTRFKVTLPLRAAMATVLHPVERMLLAPVRAWVAVHDYVGGLAEARAHEAAALRRLAAEPTTTVPMYRAVDSRFHVAVAQASRNRHAVGAVRRARASLFAWADALWVDQDWSRHEPTVLRSQRDHEEMAAAIAAGHAALAERRMYEHLVRAVDAFTGVIDDVDAAVQAATARGEGGQTCRR